MQSTTERLAYLIRCANALSDLLHEHQFERFQSPAQVERCRRWKRARAAIFRDVAQLEQTLPPGTQQLLLVSSDERGLLWTWQQSQAEAFQGERIKDPLNGRVADVSTPPGEAL